MPVYYLADLADQAEAARRADGVLVVAVDGPSGSGKSRLAKRLARALGPHLLLRADELVAGWDSLLAVPHRLHGLLRELRAGRSAAYSTWDWHHGHEGVRREVAPSPTIVVEGCGSGGLACATEVDFLLWIDAPADVRHTRAIARDGDTFAPHWERWAAQERALYATDRVRERADLIVDGRMPVR